MLAEYHELSIYDDIHLSYTIYNIGSFVALTKL